MNHINSNTSDKLCNNISIHILIIFMKFFFLEYDIIKIRMKLLIIEICILDLKIQ